MRTQKKKTLAKSIMLMLDRAFESACFAGRLFFSMKQRDTPPIRMPIEERNTEIKLPADMWVSSNLDVFLSST